MSFVLLQVDSQFKNDEWLLMDVVAKGHNGTVIAAYKEKVTVISGASGNVTGEYTLAPAVQQITGVVVSHNGTAYVADAGKQHVSVFSPRWKFVRSFGLGAGFNPLAIALDAAGDIVVLDRRNSSNPSSRVVDWVVYFSATNGAVLRKWSAMNYNLTTEYSNYVSGGMEVGFG